MYTPRGVGQVMDGTNVPGIICKALDLTSVTTVQEVYIIIAYIHNVRMHIGSFDVGI